ncbi:MAG: winged helix-turn-helix domain-containing protein [Solirubrobacteraceae bacterium]
MTPPSRPAEPAKKPDAPASGPRASRGTRAKQATPVSPPALATGPREGSTIWAAIGVLRGKRKPMSVAEIYSEIRERKLAPGLKGKTPEQTVAAQLAVAAKRGLYVERAEPGKFRLKSEHGATPAAKPKQSDEGGSR